MTGFFVRGTLNKWGKDEAVTNPPLTNRSRGTSIRDGALLGAATFGLTAATLVGARGGLGAALAGKGILTTAKFAGKAALPWALAAGAAGAVIGAGVGATLKEPDVAIKRVRDQAWHTGLKWGGIGGGVAGLAAGALVGFKTHSFGKTALAGGVAAAAAGLYLTSMITTQSATWNASAVWANSPKR
jgi:hypothetical protein